MGYFGKALSPSSYLPVHVSGVLEHCMYSRNAALLEPFLWRRVGALENRLDLTSERHRALHALLDKRQILSSRKCMSGYWRQTAW